MSNPDAPTGAFAVPEKSNLSNQDFRKLMMTPRVSASEAKAATDGSGVAASIYAAFRKPTNNNQNSAKSAAEKKKHKQNAEYFKEKMRAEAELAAKYRDRAKERREGKNDDYAESDKLLNTLQAENGTEEDRLKMLEETKFLGGDLEHTHLVKGLDYALLQKVRSEIEENVNEDEELENEQKKKELELSTLQFKTKIGRNIVKVVFEDAKKKKNDMFFNGRMAYVFDLSDEPELDVPTTTIRSIADMKLRERNNAKATGSSNEIVLNKLQSIFLSVRQGVRGNDKTEYTGKRAGKKRRKEAAPAAPAAPATLSFSLAANKTDKAPSTEAESIFSDAEDYDETAEITTKKKTAPQSSSVSDLNKDYFKNIPEAENEKEDEDDDAVSKMLKKLKKSSKSGFNAQVDDMEKDLEEHEESVTGYTNDFGINDVTGPYPSDDVTGPYPSDDVTGPYPSDDVTGPYPSDDVTGPYPSNDVTAAYPPSDNQYATSDHHYDNGVTAAYPGEQMSYQESINYQQPSQEELLNQLNAYDRQNNLNQASAEQPSSELTQFQKDKGMGTVFKKGGSKEQKRRAGSDKREREVNFVPDSYSECYPTNFGETAYDSDHEEPDYDKMDLGVKKNKIKRWDFENEEEWEKHKETAEALPKAAFQFGVKMSDGRATRRSKGQNKEKNKKDKIDRELNMINKMMNKRVSKDDRNDDKQKRFKDKKL